MRLTGNIGKAVSKIDGKGGKSGAKRTNGVVKFTLFYNEAK